MSTINPRWPSLVVPLFLCAQILVSRIVASGEHPPAPPPLDRFPASFGEWKLIRTDPIDPEVVAELRADRLVSQTYFETSTRSFASLLMAWFETQQGGARQPHSPKVCLPSGGWTPRIVDKLTVDTAAGAIKVNRYVVDKGTQSAVVLYWYQTPRRVIANEWASKFWLLADALQDKRTDTALVRVTTWPGSIGDDGATAVAGDFTRDLYPKLREYLPR